MNKEIGYLEQVNGWNLSCVLAGAVLTDLTLKTASIPTPSVCFERGIFRQCNLRRAAAARMGPRPWRRG